MPETLRWSHFKNTPKKVKNCPKKGIINTNYNSVPINALNDSPRPARGRHEGHRRPVIFHLLHKPYSRAGRQGPLDMERELNSPGEMIRRIVFIIYLGCWTVTLVFGALAILHFHPQKIMFAIGAIAVCLAIKHAGEQHLDFRRLARSFPTSDPADVLADSLRQEVEELLHKLAADDIVWQDRHEIRQRLKILIEKDPRILSIFRTEFSAVCPAMLHREPKNV
jgi:hypothetical protein